MQWEGVDQRDPHQHLGAVALGAGPHPHLGPHKPPRGGNVESLTFPLMPHIENKQVEFHVHVKNNGLDLASLPFPLPLPLDSHEGIYGIFIPSCAHEYKCK